jgi:hypothetical protein
MGKIKIAIEDGLSFATQHYNIPIDEFMQLSLAKFGANTLEYESSIHEYLLIQEEMTEYFEKADSEYAIQ